MWFMSKAKTSCRKINALFHTVTLIFVQSGNLDHSDSFELRILLGNHQTLFSKPDTSHTCNQSKSSKKNTTSMMSQANLLNSVPITTAFITERSCAI